MNNTEQQHAKLWLDIAKIDQEKSVQMREATDAELVREYAEALSAGQELPPITVFREGTAYYLADGWHRLKAHEATGRTKIEVKIIKGTHRDATLYAIGANASHGRQRTLADKEKAILFLLADTEWSQLSDQELLRKAKITDPSFVNKTRKKYHVKATTHRQIVHHGKLRTIDVRNLGAKKKDYAKEFADMPYPKQISNKINKVILSLEKYCDNTQLYLTKREAVKMRHALAAGLAEIENRLIAKKINARK